MHVAAWILQVLLALNFIVIGVMHFVLPDGLPDQAAWMYDLPTWMHYVMGTLEILGGLGLVLPALTRIRTWLTPLAAGGLAVLMASAAIWHVSRGEFQNVPANVVLLVLLVFVGYTRWRKVPISSGDVRSSAAAS